MNELEFVTTHRRHLHQHPELSLQEFETTDYIAAFLDNLSVEYKRPLDTVLIAYFLGNGKHTIAYRADIDALPIFEENDVPYRSLTDNVMHACGHDGHTTVLMLFVKRCKAMADQGHCLKISFLFSNQLKKPAAA